MVYFAQVPSLEQSAGLPPKGGADDPDAFDIRFGDRHGAGWARAVRSRRVSSPRCQRVGPSVKKRSLGPVLPQSLRRLARLYGVQTAYYDFFKKRRDASRESVLGVLELLGAPVQGIEDVPGAIRARTQEHWQRVLEPVVVVRPGHRSSVEIRLPAARAGTRLSCSVRLEDGVERRWVSEVSRGSPSRARKVEGIGYLAQNVPLPRDLPAGYHELTIDGLGKVWRCLVIAAPLRAFAPAGRQWGAFLPLYALHFSDSWGAGDFSDLERFQVLMGQLGASLVSVLPILADHPQTPFDPSPYSPSSRLFWNEFYIDPRRVPELADCPGAQHLVASPQFQRDVALLREAPLVDYERQQTLRRPVLEALARSLAGSRNARYDALQRFVAAHPSLRDYAAFKAVLERRRVPWTEWPEPLRGGTIGPTDRDPGAFFYHLYVQWLAEEQLAGISAGAVRKPGLYLDLPLGVHVHGYDTWRYRDDFVLDACGGAPPDEVFTRGQNWQFPPLHPESVRVRGYRYLIGCLRHQLTHAAALRIDHVMALHRLYWVLKGRPASDGVYVRYRSDELYAILCLESHRHHAAIVGENLGTVPSQVNASLARHGILQMYVVQYEAKPTPSNALRRVPAHSVASLNTHDMPPFAAYLRGLDLQDRLELGLLPRARLRGEQRTRLQIRRGLARFLRRRRFLAAGSPDEEAIVRATLTWLAASSAKTVLINLEDLWLETTSQNVPGTGRERPNWRHRARYALDEIAAHPTVAEMLRQVTDARARVPRKAHK